MALKKAETVPRSALKGIDRALKVPKKAEKVVGEALMVPKKAEKALSGSLMAHSRPLMAHSRALIACQGEVGGPATGGGGRARQRPGTIGARNILPYAMNAMMTPNTMLMTMDPISWYLRWTPMNTRLSMARIVAATTVSVGRQ